MILITFLPCSMTGAQEVSEDLARSIADLKTRIEQDQGIAESVRTAMMAQLQFAESTLGKMEEFKQRIAADEQAASTAARRSADYVSEKESLQATPPETPVPTTPLAEIDAAVIDLKSRVEAHKQALTQNEQENNRRTSRRQELRSQLNTVEQQLGETQLKIVTLSADDNSLPTQVIRVVLQSSLRLGELERAALIAEQNRYEVAEKEKLLRTQRDFLNAHLAQDQALLAVFEQLQAAKRQQVARESADAAAREQSQMQSQNPLLAKSYQINTSLAQRVLEVEALASENRARLESANEQLGKLTQQYRDTEKRIKSIGLTGSVGAMLRKRKSELPSPRRSLGNADQIKSQVNEIQFEIFDVQQQLEELSIQTIEAEIEEASGPQDLATMAQLQQPITELILSRKERLESLESSLDRLLEQLFDIESRERELARQATQYRDYINERILWIRSNEHIFAKLEIDSQDHVLVDPAMWTDTFGRTWQVLAKSAAIVIPIALIFLLLLVIKPRLRAEADRQGQIAGRGSCDTFWPTVQASVLTVLISITIPLILLVPGWLMSRSLTPDNPLFNALGPALIAVAWFALPFDLLRRMCRPKGLANMHFDWTDSAVAKLRNNLGKFVIPGCILVFLVVLLRNLDQTHRVDLIERLLFAVGMLGVSYFAWKTFHPRHGIFDEYLKSNELSWASQTWVLWFGLVLLLPVALAVLVLLGYYYTAINLARCAFWTFVFAVVVETIRELAKRMILVQRRHVHIQAARKKREAQLQARRELQRTQSEAQAAGSTVPADDASNSATTSSTLGTDYILDLQHELDIDESAKQANKLVSLTMIVVWAIGLWMIWTDVLPALRALDNYQLSSTGVAVNEKAPASPELPTGVLPGPSPAAGNAPAPAPSNAAAGVSSLTGADSTTPETGVITVRNLLIFLVIAIITLISIRNLPSALEMVLLEHLPVDRSVRYAVKALISYAIAMVGMILAFRALSITWTNIQWLATALTFGLAFGLQEIFANFVAGIILMFERPIRIGDWITVDDFTGIVTKIRTRATTIVNWDRKEYVIPNKDFITGRLVNWTLSDTLNRIVIQVGVAYGSDIAKTKEILFDVCSNHPKTIDDPPTRITFEQFGENSLTFVIRTFLTEIESRLQVIDDLHTEIDAAFREAGIVVAFPQRDLHLCSVDDAVARTIRDREQFPEDEA